jgi:hypothetical protein
VRRIGIALVTASLLICTSVAAATSTTPGTAKQVAALVAASTKIKKLPSTTTPSLADAPSDAPYVFYPTTNPNCSTVTQCVFGDVKSKKTLVLFGDSHARMWLTSMIPQATASKVRIVLLWYPSCPVADVTVENNSGCDAWRTASEQSIKTLDPFLIFTSNDTNQLTTSATPFTDAQWKAGVEATIRTLKSKSTKVVMIGDVPTFNASVPACLSTHLTSVQDCAVPNPNTAVHQHQAAEAAAAKAMDVTYINPGKWLCSKTCSPVIGDFIAYGDSNHLTYSYAAYLSTVFGDAIKSML